MLNTSIDVKALTSHSSSPILEKGALLSLVQWVRRYYEKDECIKPALLGESSPSQPTSSGPSLRGADLAPTSEQKEEL